MPSASSCVPSDSSYEFTASSRVLTWSCCAAGTSASIISASIISVVLQDAGEVAHSVQDAGDVAHSVQDAGETMLRLVTCMHFGIP